MTQIVNLDEISQDGRVVLAGAIHTVKPMSAKMLTVIRGEGDNLEKMLTVVADRCSTLTREVLLELSLPQLEAIIEVSMGGVKTVEQADPNEPGPTTVSTSPA